MTFVRRRQRRRRRRHCRISVPPSARTALAQTSMETSGATVRRKTRTKMRTRTRTRTRTTLMQSSAMTTAVVSFFLALLLSSQPSRSRRAANSLVVVFADAWSLSSLFYGDGDGDGDEDEDEDGDKADANADAGGSDKITAAGGDHGGDGNDNDNGNNDVTKREKGVGRSRGPSLASALPRILSRDIEASISAAEWPTTVLSPLCEAWAYLDAGPKVKSSFSSSFADAHGEENNGTDDDDNDDDHAKGGNVMRKHGVYYDYERWKWAYLDALASGVDLDIDTDLVPDLDRNSDGEDVPSDEKEERRRHWSWTYQDTVAVAMRAAGISYRRILHRGTDVCDDDGDCGFRDEFDARLLRYDLALRAHAPLCELHRALARDVASSSGLYDTSSFSSFDLVPKAFAVSYPSGIVSAHPDDVVRAHLRGGGDGDGDGGDGDGINGNNNNNKSPLLPGERPRSVRTEATTKATKANDRDGYVEDNVIVLYGQWGASAFREYYNSLKEANVPFVCRFMGAIDYEERRAEQSLGGGGDEGREAKYGIVMGGTVLQGYGVRLDIRNIEYKVFDDKAEDDNAAMVVGQDDDDDDDDEGHDDDNDVVVDMKEGKTIETDAAPTGDDTIPRPKKKQKSTSKLRAEYVAGFNLTRIAERSASSSSFSSPSSSSSSTTTTTTTSSIESVLLGIQSETLLESHSYRSYRAMTIPPPWQRRDLALQAAHAIATSIDPLFALQDVSQNLPSYASTLVEVDVPSELKLAAVELGRVPVVLRNGGGGGYGGIAKGNAAQGQGSEGAFAFYVNGRRIAVDRPSFNLFELMGVLREEDALLRKMEGELGPYLRAMTATGTKVGSSDDEDDDDGDGTSSSLLLPSPRALAAVRDMVEMGEDALNKLGRKKATFGNGKSENDDDEDDEEEEEGDDDDSSEGGTSSTQGKFRIDVGRGYRGAVLYVNDIEKDPQYAQWPRSVQQMLMMVQFGAPPTVRRNLFTMLIAIDPSDEIRRRRRGKEEEEETGGENDGRGGMASFDVSLGLIQSNFPVRLGFLIVGKKDVKECRSRKMASSSSLSSPSTSVADGGGGDDGGECTVPPALPPDSNGGGGGGWESHPASAHAFMILFVSVQSSYGGMMGLSWMNFILGYLSDRPVASPTSRTADTPNVETTSLGDLIAAHVKFLERAVHMPPGEAKQMAIAALEGGKGGDGGGGKGNGKATYAKAVAFAVEKNVVPGMAFLNGIPLPVEGHEDEGEGVNVMREMQRIVMEEQRNVMEMISQGKITDKGPRSIYAMLLSGPGVYPRMHPLLTEARGTYASPSHGFGDGSLLRPNNHPEHAAVVGEGDEDDVPAGFVVEAHLDLSSEKGLSLARTFLDVMDALPSEIGGDGVDVSYRLVPTNAWRAGRVGVGVASILSSAAQFGVGGIKALIRAAQEALASGADVDDDDAVVDSVAGVGEDIKAAVSAAASSRRSVTEAGGSDAPDNFLLVNGRLLELGGQFAVDPSDVEILLVLEMTRARAVAKMLKPHKASRDAVGKTSAFLGRLLADDKNRIRRTDAEAQLRDLKSPLHFEWNGDSDENFSKGGDRRRIQVKVTAILDPLSEPTQRVAPLLRAIRDQLKLPLRVVVVPRVAIGADDSLPITSYYRFVADPLAFPTGGKDGGAVPPGARFRNLPTNHVLTIRMDVPEPWNVQQSYAVQDTDNLRCDVGGGGGCGDAAYLAALGQSKEKSKKGGSRIGLTRVEYDLSSLLFFGQCYDVTEGTPPNGLQLTMDQAISSSLTLSGRNKNVSVSEMEISADGSTLVTSDDSIALSPLARGYHSDTLVMKTVGYWQLRAKPGVFTLTIANNTRGSEIYQMVQGTVVGGGIKIDPKSSAADTKTLVMKDFVNRGELLLVQKKPGFEDAELFSEKDDKDAGDDDDDVIHVFSLATGHLYERFLKIMMLSVTKRTSAKVKFWLFENYLSPSFKASATAMAERIGCEVAFVTYKWPEWLRGQSEKQRIIWGYKILFLDTLFPLDVKKIIYVDADQVVRGDLRELWEMDLHGAPYGYTPFCDSRETTLGYQFWRSGFWKSHLGDRPYHISALYVVDLRRFRRELVGDKLRQYYQQLSADPNSLANLDQDLPNYAQHDVRIFSLPQVWLWCESWCSDETKPEAKTIDLCNNPLHKEPKVSMAKRIISGELFEESWIELDAEVQKYEDEYRASLVKG